MPVGSVPAFVGACPQKQQLSPPVLCANPENPISVGQATGLIHTGGSAVPGGVAASEGSCPGPS